MIYLLVYDDIHVDTSFGLAFEDSVEAVIFVEFAWPPKIQLWRKPPVLRIGSYATKLYRGKVGKGCVP